MNIILGIGEVAQALNGNLESDQIMYDKSEWEHLSPREVEFLHICIPYSNEFIEIVQNAQEIFITEHTIIHSTVRPGTSDKINNCHYSPILGRHSDDFEENMGYYTKPMAGPKNDTFDKFQSEYKREVSWWGSNTDSLEFAKVMSTSYMYWCLVYEKLIHAECKKHGYDFNDVYTKWNMEYNAGIEQLHPSWQRPVYDHVDSHTPGGHCLSANIYLDDSFISKFLREWDEFGGVQLLHQTKK
jgi:hypothetical protein